MARTADKLHELIHSMSMSEKRYFRLFANRYESDSGKNYLVLFDLLEAMPVYDADQLSRRLEKAGLPTRHTASDKNYLYHLILRGLSAFYAGSTLTQRIKEALHQVEILYERGLHRQGLALLRKIKPQAAYYSLYPLLLEILAWEQKALALEDDPAAMLESLEESVQALAKMDNLSAFTRLYYQMLQLRRETPCARSQQDAEAYGDLFGHPFMVRAEVAMSFQAELLYQRIRAMYFASMRQEQEELRELLALLRLMRQDPEQYEQEFPLEVAQTLGRILWLRRREPEAEFRQELDAFRAFPERVRKSRRDVALQVLIDSRAAEMARALDLGQAGTVRQQAAGLSALLDDPRLPAGDLRRSHLQYQLAAAWLSLGEPRSALPFLNALLNSGLGGTHPHRFRFARLLNLAAHHMLGNADLVRYESDSLSRALRAQPDRYCAERTLAGMFRKLARTPVSSNEVLQHGLESLLCALEDPFEQELLDQFGWPRWIRAQQARCSMLELAG
jgi:hypothetical protein